ncbi:MAG: magnesium transporter [Acidobacteria bacterium]|nr:magnesium transporter [Acidobacteriota bacterium]
MSALEELRERINLRLDESHVGISEAVSELAPEDLVELLNQLTLIEAASVVMMLPVPRIVELLDQPTMSRRAAIVEKLDPKRAAQVIEGLSADERTDIVQQMGLHERRRILAQVNTETKNELEHLLQYADHTAGGIMTTEFVSFSPEMTVGDALKQLRTGSRDKESIYACYVLDERKHLLGAVSLRDLVMGEVDQSIASIMRRKPITVEAQEDQESVAKKIAKYNLLAVPVIESNGSVVGFVTVDDVLDVVTEEQTEDILKLAGIKADALEKPYFENSIFNVVRQRVPWLIMLFMGGLLTIKVLHYFEAELEKVVMLAFFIPLLIGTGGNAGSQTVITVIRSLSLGEIGVQNAWKVLVREATTGFLAGLLLSVVAFGLGYWMSGNIRIGFTVGATVISICVWSTAVGALIPIGAHRIGVDPAVLSAPMISTLVDATGLLIYLTIARLVLGQI